MNTLTLNNIDTVQDTCVNTDLKDNKAIIAITPDCLAIPKKLPIESKNDIEWLIKGKIGQGYTIIGDVDTIQNIITNCYNAIESNTTLTINTDCGIIIKFN